MTAVTFAGLASGLDTSALVTQLVNAERAPANAIASHQADINSQKSIVGRLSAALSTLGTAVKALSLPTQTQPRTASSSDGHVTVAASPGAVATVHDVRVTSVAHSEITSSREFDSADAGVLGTGSVTITTGANSKQIDYGSSDSLADIASKINDAGLGAKASVLFDGSKYRLMVASTDTGKAAAASFVDGGDSLGLSDIANIKVPAQDAVAMIDGVKVTRGKNVIDDAVSGLTITLVSAHPTDDPTASSALTVSLDTAGLKNTLTQFVAAYNAVNSAVHAQLDYTGTKRGTDTLFGDSMIRQLEGALGNVMTSGYGSDVNDPKTIGAVGLTRARDGSLTIDDTKLSAALAANPNAIGDLFVTGGFAAAMTAMTDAYSRSGDGILSSKTQSLNDRFDMLQTQSDLINRRADALQTQLEAQFNALETAMSKMKSQSAFLSSMLS
jgi:flagellar hook-associated protein 2